MSNCVFTHQEPHQDLQHNSAHQHSFWYGDEGHLLLNFLCVWKDWLTITSKGNTRYYKKRGAAANRNVQKYCTQLKVLLIYTVMCTRIKQYSDASKTYFDQNILFLKLYWRETFMSKTLQELYVCLRGLFCACHTAVFQAGWFCADALQCGDAHRSNNTMRKLKYWLNLQLSQTTNKFHDFLVFWNWKHGLRA